MAVRPPPIAVPPALIDALRGLRSSVDSILCEYSPPPPPPRPGLPLILAAKELCPNMAAYVFLIGAPPSSDASVTMRHLHTNVDGADQPVQDAAPGTNWSVSPIDDGQVVIMFVVDTNPTGDSPPGANLTFTVTPPGGGGAPPAPGAPFIVAQTPV